MKRLKKVIDQDQARSLIAEGKTLKEVAEFFECSPRTIKRHCPGLFPKGRPAAFHAPEAEKEATRVQDLAAIGLSDEQISLIMDCSESTLKASFSASLKKGRARIAKNILAKQMYLAFEKDNCTMLIWLGKQYCGQRDKHEVSGPNGEPAFKAYAGFDPDVV